LHAKKPSSPFLFSLVQRLFRCFIQTSQYNEKHSSVDESFEALKLFTITAVSLGRYSIYWVIVDDSKINFIEIIINNLERIFFLKIFV